MAQWGDKQRVQKQIAINNSDANRSIAIEKGGWKGKLADSIGSMADMALKQSYIEKNQRNKQAYDKGVLEETRKYDEGQLEKKDAKTEAAWADSELEEPKTAAGKALKIKREKETLGNEKTRSMIRQNDAQANKANRWENTSAKSKMSNIFVDDEGNPVSSADVDAAYKVAAKQSGANSDEVAAILEKKQMELDSLEMPDPSWYTSKEDDADEQTAYEAAVADIEAKYKSQLAPYGIEKIMKRLGVSVKGSRPNPMEPSPTAAPAVTVNPEAAARMARLRGQ